MPEGRRRLRGRAVRVERARRGGARGVARPRRDRLRGLGRVHPARGGGPDRVHPRRRPARAVRGVPPRACRPRARGRGRPRPTRGCACRSCSEPEPLEPLPDGRTRGGVHHGRDRGGGRARPGARVHQPGAPLGAGRRARPSGRRALRRLPHRAEGRRHRHGRDARPRRGRPRGLHPQPADRHRRRPRQAYRDAA